MQITDPMISATGRIYSLAGIKKLLYRVTKAGGVENTTASLKKRKVSK